MSKLRDKIIYTIVVIEAIFLVLPTTLIYLSGLALSLLGFLHGNEGTLTPAYLYISMLLLLPGYSLFSLWWLIIRYKEMTVSAIPIHIWVGLLIGVLISFVISSPFNLSPPTEFISIADHIQTKIVFGLGATIVVFTIILVIGIQNSSKQVAGGI